MQDVEMLDMQNYADKTVKWDGDVQEEGLNILLGDGGFVVTPTKVGYIIATSDKAGLERKFSAKNRKRNKPGVVLVSSMEQLEALAEMTPNIKKLYQSCFDRDILLGCILPWKEEGKQYIPDDGSDELMTDVRGTSCFVIKFGVPGEQFSKELWEREKKLMFASSANPSGKGNRGLVEGIGNQIADEADLIIDGNDYVASIQPEETAETRYEQGVMISFVEDESGKLLPDQEPTDRDTEPAPIFIRKGLYNTELMELMAEDWNSWDYRHGHYY